MCPYNYSYITKDNFRTFVASQALRVWYLHDTSLKILSTQTPRGQGIASRYTIIMEARKRVANHNDGCVYLSPTAIVMFTVALFTAGNSQRSPNIIAHEAQFMI